MKISHLSTSPSKEGGFSLVELIVSMTVLTGILLLFVGFLDQTQRAWNISKGRVEQFREARVAFDIISKNLSQATLNAYFEQYDEDADGIPERYEITSELHFKTFKASDHLSGSDYSGHALFFQAPLGTTRDEESFGSLANLLNARGYYLKFGSDEDFRPKFTRNLQEDRFRYRVMEYLPPTEENPIYNDHQDDMPTSLETGVDPDQLFFQGSDSWYADKDHIEEHSRPLAENVIALIISPREPLAEITSRSDASGAFNDSQAYERIAPEYAYDSEVPQDTSNHPDAIDFKHTLPPMVKITMVAIDEFSAGTLSILEGQQTKYANKFVPEFSRTSRYDKDIEELENALLNYEVPINYKIFSTTVAIQASKWSRIDNGS